MATTRRSDVIYVDQLQEAIQGAFTGRHAMYGTGAAIINTSLPSIGSDGSKLKGGDTIRVPYFDVIGEMTDVTETQGLVPVRLTETSETSSVVHSGIAAELTNWAQLSAQFADPYKELGRQIVESWIRRIDAGLIAKLTSSGSYTSPALVNDISAKSGSAAQISLSEINNTSALWRDEQEDVVMLVVHSYVFNQMRNMTDAIGRPLLSYPKAADGQQGTIGGDGIPQIDKLHRFAGYPVKVSDRMPVTGTAWAAGATYTSAIVKAGALAAWVNAAPQVLEDTDILTDSLVQAAHVYHVEHLYKRPANRTRCGCVLLVSA